MSVIVGVDEAGRGPLAGPVAVGVVVVPGDFDWSKLPGVTDSKKLSEKKREEIFVAATALKQAGELEYRVAFMSAKNIDTIGIVPSIKKALAGCLETLAVDAEAAHIKLDGGLVAPAAYVHQETIIKGDQKEKVIGLASICAKVMRDRYMVRKSAEQIFAPYDFATHKGYGTKKHRAAIKEHGLSELHRATYCKNI
jgi:ribonuclease HII